MMFAALTIKSAVRSTPSLFARKKLQNVGLKINAKKCRQSLQYFAVDSTRWLSSNWRTHLNLDSHFSTTQKITCSTRKCPNWSRKSVHFYLSINSNPLSLWLVVLLKSKQVVFKTNESFCLSHGLYLAFMAADYSLWIQSEWDTYKQMCI